MRTIHTNILTEQSFKDFDKDTRLWVYNGLDCMVTHEAHTSLQNLLTARPAARRVYNFEKAMQVPSLLMSRRGVRIDAEWHERLLRELDNKIARLLQAFLRLTEALGKPTSPSSPKQLAALFYEHLRIPAIYKRRKHASDPRTVTTDREALEKIAAYPHAEPLVAIIMAIRDNSKLSQVLRYGLENGRFHATFSVAGTETGRWSSYNNIFGTGGNLQNITEFLRRMFVPDPGFKFAYLDGAQAEARYVAYRSGDSNYIKAVESGDLHTTVAKFTWKRLPWTGDLKKDREVAETNFYRHFSHRDSAKRIAHGTNYEGKAFTIANILHIPVPLVQAAQDSYYEAFPGIRLWQARAKHQVMTAGYLITALGRQRHFYGRPNDEHTHKEGIAFEPQSAVGDLINRGLYNIVTTFGPHEVQALVQVHDGLLVQYKETEEARLIPELVRLMTIPVEFPSGTMVIPIDCKVGWNWANVTEVNPEGLRKYVKANP